MSKVAIVTDSTSNIPDENLENLPIIQVPLQLNWGENTYRDGIDLSAEEFYTRLQTASVMPSTSQPTPSIFESIYRDLLQKGYDIVSIHISSRLSGTLDSAIQAKNRIASGRIAVMDSLTASMAQGFIVLTAARAAASGATFDECRKLASEAVKKTGILFVVKTLEFLRRGGRIGGAAALLGTALNLKPILTVRDGQVEAQEKIRTMNKALDRCLDILLDRVKGKFPLHLALLHANAPEEAQNLFTMVKEKLGNNAMTEILFNQVSPVIGTHTGPGTVGIAYLYGV